MHPCRQGVDSIFLHRSSQKDSTIERLEQSGIDSLFIYYPGHYYPDDVQSWYSRLPEMVQAAPEYTGQGGDTIKIQKAAAPEPDSLIIEQEGGCPFNTYYVLYKVQGSFYILKNDCRYYYAPVKFTDKKLTRVLFQNKIISREYFSYPENIGRTRSSHATSSLFRWILNGKYSDKTVESDDIRSVKDNPATATSKRNKSLKTVILYQSLRGLIDELESVQGFNPVCEKKYVDVIPNPYKK